VTSLKVTVVLERLSISAVLYQSAARHVFSQHVADGWVLQLA